MGVGRRTLNIDEENLFHQARVITDSAERAAFLDAVCAGQPELRAEVNALLAASDLATSFLDRPAVERLSWENTNPIATEGPGSIIGPYKLVEQIGEGGFGIVYRAEQQEPMRREVALKTIKAGMDTHQVVARFESERQALALMDHTNIARVLDGGATNSGRPFFVMELVKGIPITNYCDEHHLSPRERLALFVPVCQAIQHAHQKGIIHRDLKPSNVLIAVQDGVPVPKVIDFGVAKALGQPLGERTGVTGIGRIVGTLEYMSPEQAEFNARDVDTRADIYSLGVLLYELLTGTTPLTKERLNQVAVTELLRWIREEEPPLPSNRLTDSKDTLASVSAQRNLEPARLTRLLRRELDWIVMKCLEKDRNRRYATANGVVRDIEHFLNDEPVDAGPPSASYKLRKLAHKHRKLLGVVATFAFFLAAAATLSTWLAVRATRAERVAAVERDRAITEKQRADAEADIARAVSRFLQRDLLAQADPREQPADQTKNKDITVRQLLDRAAQSITTKFPGQELTEAAIQLTVGNAFKALGAFEEAQKHLERARSLRQAKLSADHPDVLECIHDLGLLEESRGQYGEAERLLTQALEGRRDQLGPSHRDTLLTVSSLAELYQALGRYDESERLYKQSLEGQRQVLGDDAPDTYGNLAGLALLYQRQGRHDEAESLYKQACELTRRQLGSDNPVTLSVMNNLGLLYRTLGRHDEAEQLYQQVLDGRRRVLGPDHPDTVDSLNNLAVLNCARGRHDEAELPLQKVLESYRALYGDEHPNSLAGMHNLAVVYRLQGRYPEAESLYKQALTGRRIKLGADHPDTLATLNNLAVLYAKMKNLKEAIPLFEEALAQHRSKLGADHPHTIVTMASLGINYRDDGRLTDAIRCLEEAHAAVGERPRPLPAEFAWIANALAETYDRNNQFDKAESIYREAVEHTRKDYKSDDPNIARALSQLGWNLFQQKKFAEAEPLLLQGYLGMKGHEAATPRESKLRPAEAQGRLVQLYEAWGKPEEAAKWREGSGGQGQATPG